MKIKTTTERGCCDQMYGDLVPMHDCPCNKDYVFCKHCGRHWARCDYTDAAGDCDWKYVSIPFPWELAEELRKLRESV